MLRTESLLMTADRIVLYPVFLCSLNEAIIRGWGTRHIKLQLRLSAPLCPRSIFLLLAGGVVWCGQEGVPPLLGVISDCFGICITAKMMTLFVRLPEFEKRRTKHFARALVYYKYFVFLLITSQNFNIMIS